MKKHIHQTSIILILFIWSAMLMADDFEKIDVDGKNVEIISAFEYLPKVVEVDKLYPMFPEVYKYCLGTLLPRKGVVFFTTQLYCSQSLIAKRGENNYGFYINEGKFGIDDRRMSILNFIEPVRDENQAKELANFIFASYGYDEIIASKYFYDKYIVEMAKFKKELVLMPDMAFLPFSAREYKDIGFIVEISRFDSNNLKTTKIMITKNNKIGIIEDILVVKKYETMRNALAVSPEESQFSDIKRKAYEYAKNEEKKKTGSDAVFYSNCPYPALTPSKEKILLDTLGVGEHRVPDEGHD